MFRSRLVGLFTALAVSASLIAMPLNANANECNINSGFCTITVTTSVWTGQPTVLCPTGVPVVRVEVVAHCDDCNSWPQSFLRCGSTNTPISFSACDTDFLVKLKSGRDWEDVLTDCYALVGSPEQ